MLRRVPQARSQPAVIIMAKGPRAGEAKTRLAPLLSAEESAALAGCLFADVAACARKIAPEVIVAYAPAGGRELLEPLLPPGAAAWWLEQRGADLGERLSFVLERAWAAGFGPLVVLGSDSPTLPPEYVAEAFGALATGDHDIVLGPTDDGGYYLVGLRAPAPRLFERIEWSTPRAYQQTADNAARLKLRLRELPRWYDVDTPSDLLRLRAELVRDGEARNRAPATHAWLSARSLAPTACESTPPV
jgi:rSAM/selenodomain-associated transferase 1